MSEYTLDADQGFDARLEEASPNLRDLMAMLWDGHDPWGSVIGFAFGVNEIAYVTGNRTDDSYSPGLAAMSESVQDIAEGGDWPDAEIAEMYLTGDLTDADLCDAVPVLSDWLDALKAAGLDY